MATAPRPAKAKSTDWQGRQLVQQFEIARGNKVYKAEDGSYDYLIVEPKAEIHAEVKTASDPSKGYFAINGIKAFKRLMGDNDYRFYFCTLTPVVTILRCKVSLLLLLLNWKIEPWVIMPKLENVDRELNELCIGNKMKFDCRIGFHIPGNLEKLFEIVKKAKPAGNQAVCLQVDGMWEQRKDKWIDIS
jgi:hypothetical protein